MLFLGIQLKPTQVCWCFSGIKFSSSDSFIKIFKKAGITFKVCGLVNLVLYKCYQMLNICFDHSTNKHQESIKENTHHQKKLIWRIIRFLFSLPSVF